MKFRSQFFCFSISILFIFAANAGPLSRLAGKWEGLAKSEFLGFDNCNGAKLSLWLTYQGPTVPGSAYVSFHIVKQEVTASDGHICWGTTVRDFTSASDRIYEFNKLVGSVEGNTIAIKIGEDANSRYKFQLLSDGSLNFSNEVFLGTFKAGSVNATGLIRH